MFDVALVREILQQILEASRRIERRFSDINVADDLVYGNVIFK